MTVDVLCKVVDNFGDIGFCHRLCLSLLAQPEQPSVRLIVDDLSSYSLIYPGVNPRAASQSVSGITVVRWDEPDALAMRAFSEDRPRFVLECYACGRPEWFESLLFDASDETPRVIVDVEYLTAEPWAVEFHRLPSPTRSAFVRKFMFMPGFVAGTGGLLRDPVFSDLVHACATPDGRAGTRRSILAWLKSEGTLKFDPRDPSRGDAAELFWALVFSYERDFTELIDDFASFARVRPFVAFSAAGRGQASFLSAWERAGKPFPVVVLPMIRQDRWDSLIAACDFLVIRGEESLSRATLSGNPFLWHCYPFPADGETEAGYPEGKAGDAALSGQLPKVRAFLDLLRGRLPSGLFADYEEATLWLNGVRVASVGASAHRGAVRRLLESSDAGLGDSFAAFSRDVGNIGNLARNLLTFMREMR